MPPPTTAADPFAIGWRDVTRTLPDGSTVIEQVPLTAADALHPQEGDTFVQNTPHGRDLGYLVQVARACVAADPHALVTDDLKVLWPDGVHHSPDLCLIPNVAAPDAPRGEFDVAAEGTRPQLIIEVVSPTTRDNDIVAKVAAYYKYQVPLYVIVDREAIDGRPTLIGYQRGPRRYKRLDPEEDGRLWVEPLGVYLEARADRVAAYDVGTDRELGDYVAVAAQLEAAEARADAADARADRETKRAAAATQRAAAADARADGEKQRADAAEAVIRELQARLAATRA